MTGTVRAPGKSPEVLMHVGWALLVIVATLGLPFVAVWWEMRRAGRGSDEK